MKYECYLGRQKMKEAGKSDLIRKSIQRGQLTGSLRFVDEIERKTNRRVKFNGRPWVSDHSTKFSNEVTGTECEH
jgi:hypothetical protein